MTVSPRQACWLLRCCGFSAPSEQVQMVRRRGYEECLNQWLAEESPAGQTPWTTRVPAGVAGTVFQVGSVVHWWLARMQASRGFLREKMTLFWHGYFTTSVDPVFIAGLLLCQNQLLRDHALGRFEDLLQQISRDPAMLLYLDGFRNKPEHPNENYAREVMELFTTGPGHYSEEDLRQAARAFTGWEIAWLKGVQFRDNPKHHDSGPKKFKDLRGPLQGRDILHHLAQDPATAHHVVGRLWDFLVGLPLPSTEHQRLADVFCASHGNVSVVLRALFLGPCFRDLAGQRQALKSPIEYLLGLCAVGEQRLGLGELDTLKQMGQMPFLPPSVAGWRQGNGWLDTATLEQRLKLALKLAVRVPHQLWAERLQGVGGPQAVERLLWLGHQLDAGQPLRQQLLDMYRGPQRLQPLVSLMFASPEAQLR